MKAIKAAARRVLEGKEVLDDPVKYLRADHRRDYLSACAMARTDMAALAPRLAEAALAILPVVEAVQRVMDDGRNLLPDATDDQAAVLEAWAIRALAGLRTPTPRGSVTALLPSPIFIGCCDCDATVALPFAADDLVSIEPMTGWTAPPLRCPQCSAAHG